VRDLSPLVVLHSVRLLSEIPKIVVVAITLLVANVGALACTNYHIHVTGTAGSNAANQVSWSLVNSLGQTVISGGAPFNQNICLDDDCYTLYMWDTGNNGWGAIDWFIDDFAGDFSWDTNLNNGSFGTDNFDMGTGCAPLNCGPGLSSYTISVDTGNDQAQVSWELFDSGGNSVTSGLAPATQAICLADDCYTLWMYDSGGNGWTGESWTLLDAGGGAVQNIALSGGPSGSQDFALGSAVCGSTNCGPGTLLYNISVDGGNDETDVSWELLDSSGNLVASGFAPTDQQVCLADDCYTLNMYDATGDGWTGETWTISDEFGNLIYASFLVSGAFATENFVVGVASCAPPCNIFTITVSDGTDAPDVFWQLIDSFGVVQAAGGAPDIQNICLLDDCYSLVMFDSGADGWQDVTITIENAPTGFFYQTFLVTGDTGTDQFVIGGGICNVPVTCGPGTTEYTFNVTSGANPSEISWYFSLNNGVVQGGAAPYTGGVCLGDGCYYLQMFDQGANGWEGAAYTLVDPLGTVVQSGTLSVGASGWVLVNIGGLNCAGTEPPAPGACGSTPPSKDCFNAPCSCDVFNYHITPASGPGTIDEIPPPGSVSNPSYDGFTNIVPWGGTANFGCLLAGELNSNWMIFTVATSGLLEFAFGAGGQQAGFYDWAMWSYNGPGTCNGIAGNTQAPVRCVWNATSIGGAGLAATPPAGGDPGNYAPPLAVTAGQQFIICMSNYSGVDAMVTLDFFGSALVSCNLVLPVELLSFDGYTLESANVLNWKTQTEINNDYFIVEHSIDGQDWAEIGKLKGHGTTQLTQSYSFKDLHPAVGHNYYRLRQFDLNGSNQLSQIIVLDYAGALNVTCRPNPANDEVTIDYRNNQLTTRLQILDSSGRLVFEDKNVQNFPYVLKTAQFNSGTYIVKCSTEYGQSVTRMVVIH
jgi:Secretion system C-terminal sorting domain